MIAECDRDCGGDVANQQCEAFLHEKRANPEDLWKFWIGMAAVFLGCCWVSVSCSAKGLGSSIDCHVSDVAQVISREKSCWSSFEAEQPTLRRFDLNKEEFLKPCCNNEANGTE